LQKCFFDNNYTQYVSEYAKVKLSKGQGVNLWVRTLEYHNRLVSLFGPIGRTLDELANDPCKCIVVAWYFFYI